MFSVGELKKFIEDIDDSIAIHSITGIGCSLVKHVHFMKYEDNSGVPMLVFCPMGYHLPEYLISLPTTKTAPKASIDTCWNCKYSNTNPECDPCCFCSNGDCFAVATEDNRIFQEEE
jgi:hypothetical protein